MDKEIFGLLIRNMFKNILNTVKLSYSIDKCVFYSFVKVLFCSIRRILLNVNIQKKKKRFNGTIQSFE